MSAGRPYDYVICGAGSAGCVVAGRLSEDPDVRVLVLEAGGPDVEPEIRFPYIWPAMLKSALDWDFQSEPEPGLNNRRIYLPRGKMVGGCGSINAMIYIRGNRADFDEWAEMGNEGWSYDEVLPYFRKSEDYENGEDMFHGVGGPLAVSNSRSMNPLVDIMLEASVNAGHERNPDLNGARQEGVGRWPVTQKDGQRFSPADAFLHPALRTRSNIELITSAMTTRLLFEGDRAVGVEYVKDGVRHEVRAEREVIVSQGAFQSPTLLMLSGIGPADHLRSMGIDVRVDLPVGENYQDHLMVVLNYETDGDDSLFGQMTPENLALYEQERRGPLTSNYPEAGGFFRTRPGLRAPDVEFHYSPSMLYDEGLTVPHGPGIVLGPVVLKPESRGFVRLRSPLAHSKPVIQLNALTEEPDRQSVVAGTRLAMEIAAQSPLKERITRPFSIPAGDSEDEILSWARETAMTVFHPTSTCSMGAVVDAQLRVKGVEGLRVVDASVMPKITRANTHAATIMIGEKGADLIKGITSAPPTR